MSMYASKKHENIHNICYTLVAMFDLNLRVTENSQSLLVKKTLNDRKGLREITWNSTIIIG